MSELRPTLRPSDKPCTATGATAYLVIHGAVQSAKGLIHGKLHDNGNSCAIGSYFRQQREAVLPTHLIDEVAAVNDSVPHYTAKKRRQFVLQWLKWKLARAGMPGFRTARHPASGKPNG